MSAQDEVHEESKVLALAWLKRLAYRSPMRPHKPLGHDTIDRYEQSIVGRPVRRKLRPNVPLLEFWATVAPGEPIWTLTLEPFLEWLFREVRDSETGGTKPASDSERNNRRAAVVSFFTWLALEQHVVVNEDVRGYMPPYEERSEVRRKDMSLDPLADGPFNSVWLTRSLPHNTRLWIGQAAFMTQRIGEIANMRPDDVDLDRHQATFLSKGGGRRTVHYGELSRDWTYLPHLEDFHEQWLKAFEAHAEQAIEDQLRDPQLRWLTPHVEGIEVPRRDNPKLTFWRASKNDMNRFDKQWQKVLKAAGFKERQFHPHQLRHFAAINLWRAGVSWDRLRREMGHDQAATTDGYLRFNPAFDRERSKNEKLRRDEDE